MPSNNGKHFYGILEAGQLSVGSSEAPEQSQGIADIARNRSQALAGLPGK